MEAQNRDEFRDLIEYDLALLRATSKIEVISRHFSGCVGPTYGYLKAHLQTALGIDDKSDFEDSIFISELQKDLSDMYALVFDGAVELATKVDLKNVPLPFFMDCALIYSEKWAEVDTQKIARYYNLRALVDIARAEEIKKDPPPNVLAPEHAVQELAVSNFLVDSLLSALFSEKELRKDRSIRYEVIFDMLIKGSSGIRTHEARDEANARISTAAKEKWLPLIYEVHKRLKNEPNLTKSDACRFVTKNRGEKWSSLRNVYNRWLKNPEEYE